MEPLPDDKKIIDLLSKLKNSSGAYPSDVLTFRRQTYLRQVANVGLGIGVGTGIKNAAKRGNGAGAVATVTSKILETALIAAIVIEAGTVAYIYRAKIADLVRTYTGSSITQEPASSSNNTSSPSSGLVEISPSATNITPSVTVTTPSGTVTIVSGTSSPKVTDGDNNSNVGVNATPSPNGNNGNHYGNTPKPARTKDNNQDNNKDNNKDKDKKNKP